MADTTKEYKTVLAECRSVFLRKFREYGTSWRVLRPSSLTDQMFIKASRIKTLETTGHSRVGDGIVPEFIALVNYGILAVIQSEADIALGEDLNENQTMGLYDSVGERAFSLMEDKNHDYGEAWRNMRVSTFTDMLLMRIKRIRQLEQVEEGVETESEGVVSNYLDMVNYSIFALIHLGIAE
jgi:hypothetical protein